ncbi:peroxiredoxin, partial [Methylophaga sp. UBA3191]
TNGMMVNLAEQNGYVVVYCYPMTGRPDRDLPDGWDQNPGARGCTPQSCAFKDHHHELDMLGASVFGLSTQSSSYQQEVAERLHLPFLLLSDESLKFSSALALPTFQIDGMVLIKRLTLIIKAGRIEKFFYPVFPPNENAEQVINWLRVNAEEIKGQPESE